VPHLFRYPLFERWTSFMRGNTDMLSTLKYARYALGSLTAVLFAVCAGGS
jgi:hypothetical protein